MAVQSLGRFTSRVENYLKYRPSYPKKLIDYLYGECGFSWESVIADIGSGTGVFTRLLLERGSRVVGIEPNNEMREAAERILADEFPRFVSINATAENTTLPDASIHHIVCAQSFHWFDLEKCRREFARILRPQGSLILIYNKRLVEADAFSSEYEAFIKRYSKEYNAIGGHRHLDEADYQYVFDGNPVTVLTVPNQQLLDFDGLKGRLLSCSYIPAAGEEGYDEMLEELQILFDLYNQSGRVVMKYETEARSGRLSFAV